MLVDENVAHSCDVYPRDIVRKALLIHEMACGLADHFEIAHDRIDRLAIVLELFEGQAGNVGFDAGHCVDDILDAEPPVSRRQEPPREGSGREAAASAPQALRGRPGAR